MATSLFCKTCDDMTPHRKEAVPVQNKWHKWMSYNKVMLICNWCGDDAKSAAVTEEEEW